MKTLTLKESQTLYEAIAVAAPDEPLIVERNGQPVYVLVPYAEYQAQHPQRSTLPVNWFEQTPEEVVADIKRQGPGVPNVRLATASLRELLENSPSNPDFDLEEWTREWTKIEAEMKAAEKLDWAKTEAEMRAILEGGQ
jgi:hypothetical protein